VAKETPVGWVPHYADIDWTGLSFPQEKFDELQRFDVKAQDLLQRRDSAAFQSLMQFQAERAHGYYEQALGLLPSVDRRSQKPGLMMASIYRTLLREIEAAQFPVLRQRVALTPARKLWLAWKMQALGRF
jgi:phytoene synthase